jgi:hypothetical protein
MDAGQGQTDAGQWTDDSTGSSGTGLLLFTDAPATQMPAQLMWSFAGSHLSDGSSMHFIPLGHFIKGLAQGCFGVLEDLDSEDDIFP